MSYRILFSVYLIHILPLIATSSYGNRLIKRKDGSIRLLGGDNFNEGNIEILHLGRWGAICDHTWTVNEATVVCKQLGFSENHKGIPTKSARFGKAKSKQK